MLRRAEIVLFGAALQIGGVIVGNMNCIAGRQCIDQRTHAAGLMRACELLSNAGFLLIGADQHGFGEYMALHGC